MKNISQMSHYIFQELWKIYYDYTDLFLISALNKFPFLTSFNRIFEIIRFFEKIIKVRQQQEQQEQQSHPLKERFRNTCSRSKRLSMAETTARQLAV